MSDIFYDLFLVMQYRSSLCKNPVNKNCLYINTCFNRGLKILKGILYSWNKNPYNIKDFAP